MRSIQKPSNLMIAPLSTFKPVTFPGPGESLSSWLERQGSKAQRLSLLHETRGLSMPAVHVSLRETESDSSPAHGTEITLICVILVVVSGVFFLALLIRCIMNRRRAQKYQYKRKPRSIEPFLYETTPFDISESSGRAPLLRTESHPYSGDSLNSTLHEYSRPPITQYAWDSHQYAYITPEEHLPQVPPPVPYSTQSLFKADPFTPSLHTASDSDHYSPPSPFPGVLPSPGFHQEPVKSLQLSPKHLPRLVIPNAASMPRSARAVEHSKDVLSEQSSGSEYSQPSASSSFIQQSFHSQDLAIPPIPPHPDYIVMQGRFQDESVGLGRTNTVEIASLLKDRAKRDGSLLRVPSNISHIERWNSIVVVDGEMKSPPVYY
ncbi:uncharacterized protein EV420DRAFT_834007 [Desarmillaria tabescens]|uniref:Uncharacterized protein n=1 Tax=Armillaria tabescens TaxID=1929756 RepID=A0AA39JU34_ARMTA|nr:uncharacterized protein EV420DRAFT_834007 [Desarmillaria tabescens]KAK0448927.1 hypothetical protein EV420DRAFT_834007 [Desarmillaria tabescens]